MVAEIALALGRERVNIEDMALYPATDMSTGAITLWVAGAEEAERAAEVVRGLGHRRLDRRLRELAVAPASFEPSGPLRGSLRPPPDKSISHRAAIIGAMGEGTVRVEGYLDAADTRSTLDAVRALGAEVREVGRSASAPGGIDLEIEGVGLRGPGERAGDDPVQIDVGNAGTLMRLLPGWLAGQRARRLGPRRRQLDPPAPGGPGRRSARRDGRRASRPTMGCRRCGSRHALCAASTYRLPVASAQVKSCVLLAGLLAEGETT